MPSASPDSIAALKRRLSQITPRLACFDADDYVALNPDLAEVDPFEHFAGHGVWERRTTITSERLTARLASAVLMTDLQTPDREDMAKAYCGALDVAPTIHLPVDSDYVDRAIARRLCSALGSMGVKSSISSAAPKLFECGAIIIRPDLFFQSANDERHAQFYMNSVVVISEKPHTLQFQTQIPYMLAASAVIAVEAETYALLKEAGIKAAWIAGAFAGDAERQPPPDHPLMLGLGRGIRDAPPHLPWADRPIDVLALEPASLARTNAWGRMAEGMATFRTIFYQPQIEAYGGALEASLRRYLSARSKIVLHLHEAAPTALSSLLIEETLEAGAIVVSEPCPPHPYWRPGRHYFEASARRMPALVETLIHSDQRRLRARTAIAAARRRLALVSDLETTGLSLTNLLLDRAHD